MIIQKAEYVISSPSVDSCPQADRPEYAFIGRSNVGKSSLINMLTGMKQLAKVSATPGKTQLINHFSIVSKASLDAPQLTKWYLVDLPGYGFAKVSASSRKQWEKMIEGYIRKRETLVNLFVLVDSRHTPQEIDLKFIQRLGEWQVPFAILFTKADKETQKVVSAHVKAFGDAMKKRWTEIPPIFVTSAEKRLGKKYILDMIHEMNSEFFKQQSTSKK
ncbi:MAG: YihA family ribosome biogenesis GTP-binding protein [Chitinophagia bacterium]|jgi:GTP-binding protein|nr:YihA family ribosome biogenesis GTP-binding protein [Chitinophagia bacterium]